MPVQRQYNRPRRITPRRDASVGYADPGIYDELLAETEQRRNSTRGTRFKPNPAVLKPVERIAGMPPELYAAGFRAMGGTPNVEIPDLPVPEEEKDYAALERRTQTMNGLRAKLTRLSGAYNDSTLIDQPGFRPTISNDKPPKVNPYIGDGDAAQYYGKLAPELHHWTRRQIQEEYWDARKRLELLRNPETDHDEILSYPTPMEAYRESNPPQQRRVRFGPIEIPLPSMEPQPNAYNLGGIPPLDEPATAESSSRSQAFTQQPQPQQPQRPPQNRMEMQRPPEWVGPEEPGARVIQEGGRRFVQGNDGRLYEDLGIRQEQIPSGTMKMVRPEEWGGGTVLQGPQIAASGGRMELEAEGGDTRGPFAEVLTIPEGIRATFPRNADKFAALVLQGHHGDVAAANAWMQRHQYNTRGLLDKAKSLQKRYRQPKRKTPEPKQAIQKVKEERPEPLPESEAEKYWRQRAYQLYLKGVVPDEEREESRQWQYAEELKRRRLAGEQIDEDPKHDVVDRAKPYRGSFRAGDPESPDTRAAMKVERQLGADLEKTIARIEHEATEELRNSDLYKKHVGQHLERHEQVAAQPLPTNPDFPPGAQPGEYGKYVREYGDPDVRQRAVERAREAYEQRAEEDPAYRALKEEIDQRAAQDIRHAQFRYLKATDPSMVKRYERLGFVDDAAQLEANQFDEAREMLDWLLAREKYETEVWNAEQLGKDWTEIEAPFAWPYSFIKAKHLLPWVTTDKTPRHPRDVRINIEAIEDAYDYVKDAYKELSNIPDTPDAAPLQKWLRQYGTWEDPEDRLASVRRAIDNYKKNPIGDFSAWQGKTIDPEHPWIEAIATSPGESAYATVMKIGTPATLGLNRLIAGKTALQSMGQPGTIGEITGEIGGIITGLGPLKGGISLLTKLGMSAKRAAQLTFALTGMVGTGISKAEQGTLGEWQTIPDLAFSGGSGWILGGVLTPAKIRADNATYLQIFGQKLKHSLASGSKAAIVDAVEQFANALVTGKEFDIGQVGHQAAVIMLFELLDATPYKMRSEIKRNFFKATVRYEGKNWWQLQRELADPKVSTERKAKITEHLRTEAKATGELLKDANLEEARRVTYEEMGKILRLEEKALVDESVDRVKALAKARSQTIIAEAEAKAAQREATRKRVTQEQPPKYETISDEQIADAKGQLKRRVKEFVRVTGRNPTQNEFVRLKTEGVQRVVEGEAGTETSGLEEFVKPKRPRSAEQQLQTETIPPRTKQSPPTGEVKPVERVVEPSVKESAKKEISPAIARVLDIRARELKARKVYTQEADSEAKRVARIEQIKASREFLDAYKTLDVDQRKAFAEQHQERFQEVFKKPQIERLGEYGRDLTDAEGKIVAFDRMLDETLGIRKSKTGIGKAGFVDLKKKSKPSDVPEDIFPTKESRQRWWNAFGSKVDQLVPRIRQRLSDIKHEMTRQYRNLPRQVKKNVLGKEEILEFGDLINELRLAQDDVERSQHRAIQLLNEQVADLSPAESQLMRLLPIRDLAREARRRRVDEMQFGLTREQVLEMEQKFNALVEKSPNLKKAIEKRRQIRRALVDELIDAGILQEKQVYELDAEGNRTKLKNEDYYHHQVLQYARVYWNQKTGTKPKKPTPGYAKARSRKSLLDYNTDFHEVEVMSMTRALYDIRRARRLKAILESNDITSTIKAAVEARAKDRIAKMRSDAKAQIKELSRQVKERLKGSGLEPQRIKVEVKKRVAPIQSELRQKIKQLRKDLFKELIPAGYDEMQYDPRRIYFHAKTLPEHVFDMLLDNTPYLGAEIKAQVKDVLALGGKRKTYLIPSEVKTTLHDLSRPTSDDALTRFFAPLTKTWKRWVLMNPRRALKYNWQNMLGDLDAVIAGEPGVLKWGNVREAVHELRRFYVGEKVAPWVTDAYEQSVLSSTLSFEELPSLRDLRVYESGISGTTRNPLKLWLKKAGRYTTFRENVLRLAAYRYYAERFTKGDYSHIGSSDRKRVEAVKGAKRQAGKVARELLGDYGALTELGRNLRRSVFPFYSWMEINLKRYGQNIKNSFVESATAGEGARRLGRGTAMAAARVGSKFAGYYLRALLLTGGAHIFNQLFNGESESRLGEYDRRRVHLNLTSFAHAAGLPKNRDYVIRGQTALGDVFEWFGINDVVGSLEDWRRGQLDDTDIAKTVAQAPANKLISSVNPYIKGAYEVLSGIRVFPNAFEGVPRKGRISKRLVDVLAETWSLDDEWKMLSRLIPGAGYEPVGHATGSTKAEREAKRYFNTWADILVTSKDSDELAYSHIINKKWKYLDKTRGGGSYRDDSKQAMAAYNYRRALRLQDREAEGYWHGRLREFGLNDEQIAKKVQSLDPLYGLTSEERKQFVEEYLTNRDRALLDRAIEYHKKAIAGRGHKK